MGRRLSEWRNYLGWPLVAGLSYFCAAYLALVLTTSIEGIATVWPASGIGVAALMLGGPSRRWSIAFAIGCASWLGNWLGGVSPFLALGFTLANLIECVLVSWLLGAGQGIGSFSDLRHVRRFCGSSMLGSGLATIFAMLWSGQYRLEFMLSWFTTVLLGLLIVAPLIISAAHAFGDIRRRDLVSQLTTYSGTMLVVLAVLVVTFGQNTYPLLFLPLAAAIFATYRHGMLGAASSVFLTALAGSISTMYNRGGITTLYAPDETHAIFFFQFYLLILLLSSLPLSALLTTRDRMFREITRGNKWLEMAERAARVGHWRVGLTDNSYFWSSEMARIHGYPPGVQLTLDEAKEAYVESERERIEALMAQAIENAEPFEFESRIRRVDGSICHVESHGQFELDRSGKAVALFGTFQDVTDRVVAMQKLEEARRLAQSEAERARNDAETDQLTGIANRRKILIDLRDAIARAAVTGEGLSVAILDVDHFKSINDQYGHALGDEVLQMIANCCADMLADRSQIGRIGGEEFLILLPGMSAEQANSTIERMRMAIEALRFSHETMLGTTGSFGIVNYVHGADETWLLQAADNALYAAKRGGRNRLSVAA